MAANRILLRSVRAAPARPPCPLVPTSLCTQSVHVTIASVQPDVALQSCRQTFATQRKDNDLFYERTPEDFWPNPLDYVKERYPPDYKGPVLHLRYNPMELLQEEIDRRTGKYPPPMYQPPVASPVSIRSKVPAGRRPVRLPSVAAVHKKAAALVKPQPWRKDMVRTGVIGRKLGMTGVWDKWGVRWPVTVVEVPECQVTQIKLEKDKKGLVGMQVGAGFRREKNTSWANMCHFLKAGVPPKAQVREFRVSREAILPTGFQLSAGHFLPGQYVDIRGISKGKGFAGGMKRHNFGGLFATHGVSLAHRSIGSTGATGVGKVFKGKKMPGRMGHRKVTIPTLRVHKVDLEKNLIFIVGAVPGPKGGFVEVRDGIRKTFKEDNPPPFPTFLTPLDKLPSTTLVEPLAKMNPFLYHPV